MSNALGDGASTNDLDSHAYLRRRLRAQAVADQRVIARVEYLFAFCGVLFFSGGVERLLSGFQDSYSIAAAEAGRPLVQLAGAIFYLGSLFLIYRGRRAFFTTLLRSPLLLIMMLYITVSISWAANVPISIRHVIGLWGTMFFGLYLVSAFSIAQIVRMCALALGGLAVASLVLAVGAPGLGMGHNEGGVIGLWGQKNDFGKAMVIAALFLFVQIYKTPASREKLYCIGMFVAALLGAVLSRSGTAMLCLMLIPAVIVPAILFLSKLLKRASLGFFALLGLICTAGYYVGQVVTATILMLLGKNPTLTDRTVIWALLEPYAQARPLFGYGYGGFWQSETVRRFTMRWNEISHAHNGYLDIVLELGLVGLVVLALVLLAALRRAADAYFVNRRTEDLALAVFMVVTMIANFVGRLYPEHNGFYWVVLVVIATRAVQAGDRVVASPQPRFARPTPRRSA